MNVKPVPGTHLSLSNVTMAKSPVTINIGSSASGVIPRQTAVLEQQLKKLSFCVLLLYRIFYYFAVLSLYSTRTQNTWRRGLALGSGPDARILRYPTQNIPTCWYLWRWVTHIFRVLPDAKPKSCVLPDAKYKRKPVEYGLRWVPTQNSGVGHVRFTFFVLITFALGPFF